MQPYEYIFCGFLAVTILFKSVEWLANRNADPIREELYLVNVRQCFRPLLSVAVLSPLRIRA
jgi:hypothetical protein